MRHGLLSLTIGISLVTSACAHQTGTLPADVDRFTRNRALCEHFAGEVPDPDQVERAAEVRDSFQKYCTGTDAALAALKRRYAKDDGVLEALGDYDENIEPAH